MLAKQCIKQGYSYPASDTGVGWRGAGHKLPMGAKAKMKKRALHVAMFAAGGDNMPTDNPVIYPTPPCMDELSFTRGREGYVEVIEIDEGVGTEVCEFNLYLSPFDHWRI